MEKSYIYKKKTNVIYLMIFIIIFGSFFIFSLSETINSSNALKIHQSNQLETVNENTYDSWDSAEHDLERKYQFNLAITIITILLASIVFFATFYSRNKLEINHKGIFILDITGKNYAESYQWRNIDDIEIAYSQGLASILFEKSLIIHQSDKSSMSIPLESFENGAQIIEIIRANNFVEKISKREAFKTNNNGIFDYFSEAIIHLKNNIKIYLSLSAIILVFASLNRLFNDSAINSITLIATLYFGVKANIAVNIYSYESYNNNYLSFSEVWEKTKGKFGRYYSSLLVQGLFQIPFFLLALYIYRSNGNIFSKGIMFFFIGVLYSASIFWLFLLPYIASITTSKKSYFSLNASILKEINVKVVPLVLFELVSVIILITVFISNDLATLINVNQFMLISILVDFIKIPFFSAYVMRIIHKAPFLEVSEDEEIKEAI